MHGLVLFANVIKILLQHPNHSMKVKCHALSSVITNFSSFPEKLVTVTETFTETFLSHYLHPFYLIRCVPMISLLTFCFVDYFV